MTKIVGTCDVHGLFFGWSFSNCIYDVDICTLVLSTLAVNKLATFRSSRCILLRVSPELNSLHTATLTSDSRSGQMGRCRPSHPVKKKSNSTTTLSPQEIAWPQQSQCQLPVGHWVLEVTLFPSSHSASMDTA